jgi:crotonobetainyl-CoA:carnitine CoA-transferase CaiB-like acyl-CoA transferase
MSKVYPLTGIRVLDLTRILAGPLCTQYLGDLGAEIIKIENPKGGDDTRAWGPPFLGTESAYYLGINRNKKKYMFRYKNKRRF